MTFFRNIIFLVMLTSAEAKGQSLYMPLENNADFFARKKLSRMNVYHHGSIRPYTLPDSSRAAILQEQKALADAFFSRPFLNNNPDFGFSVLPLGGFTFEQYSGHDDTTVSDVAMGAMAVFHYKEMLTLSGDFVSGTGTFSPFWINRVDTLDIVPGNGTRYDQEDGKIYYENWNASLSFSPNRYINVQLGKGKHFWGYGYRSLFLSDNATNYPFLKLTTEFWRIKYVSMVAQMKDTRYARGSSSSYFTKYATMHLLSWNITKRLNINVFEAVVWQAKDTLQNRQLDINYLNPVIFYRPVEYSLGSSDNSILGLGAQVKINHEISIYGQALLDEFLLSQIKADSGWWANKYGLQIGVKAFEPFKLKGLTFQTEYNAVRPFTYSHGSVYQNYAHFYQPLAHPMGANFRDWVTLVEYRYKWITVSNKTVIANYGTDTSTLNYGGNLYQSYRDRAQDYHNFIGQGLNNELFMNRTAVEMLLVKQNNLKLEFAYTIRKLSNKYAKHETSFFTVAISANLYNRYNDY